MATEAQKRANSKYHQTEKRKVTNVRYEQSEKGKSANARANRRYEQTEKGKVVRTCIAERHRQTEKYKVSDARAMARRKRDLNYSPINKRFSSCVGHHLNPEDVIFIPAELHKLFSHRQSNLESMKLINNAAFEWLCTQEILS